MYKSTPLEDFKKKKILMFNINEYCIEILLINLNKSLFHGLKIISNFCEKRTHWFWYKLLQKQTGWHLNLTVLLFPKCQHLLNFSSQVKLEFGFNKLTNRLQLENSLFLLMSLKWKTFQYKSVSNCFFFFFFSLMMDTWSISGNDRYNCVLK